LGRLESAVIAAVDEEATRILAVLKDLIRTESPSGAEGTAGDANSMVGKVHAAAALHGTTVTSQSIGSNSENVIEVLDGVASRAFVIEAHTDAVPPGDTENWLDGDPYSAAEGWVEYLGGDRVAVEVGSRRFEASIRPRMSKIWEKHRSDRRRRILYGRGSFDNKGCVASALLAMSALARACKQLDVRLGGTVVAAYTVDEEESAAGIKRFACAPDSWLASHGFLSGTRDGEGMLTGVSGVALDGSYGWVPVVGHRGAVQLAVTTRGRAAHAATPELGVNAVTAMARIIVALADGANDLADSIGQELDPSLLGPMTMAVGSTIAGGGVRGVRMQHVPIVERSGINSIPDWCEATIDIRFPQGTRYPSDIREKKDAVVAAVHEYIDSHVDHRGWSYELTELVSVPPVAMAQSFESAAALPLVQQERRRAYEVLGFEPELETAPGGTDATFMIHEARIPTIVELGPAGGLSHDVHEFVEVDSIIAGSKILALLAIDRLGLVE
jgi:acetylornithine deacetylase/succinyl-diaminopimelate desuccinylase-like protein